MAHPATITHRVSLALASFAALGATALAGPQFVAGDIYLASSVLSGLSNRGVLRVDPTSWQGSILISFAPSDVPGFFGRVAYDPWRDRLVIPDSPTAVTLIDASGARAPLPYAWPPRAFLLAPTRDGRIYMTSAVVSFFDSRLAYIDAAGATHVVMDASGSTHYVLPLHFDAATYDHATNALIVAIPEGSPNVRFRRLALSADGSRVIDDSLQSTFNVSPTGPRVQNMGPGPGGLLFAKVDDNSSGFYPRMLLVDPATLAVSTFASSEYFGVGGEVAGCWSPVSAGAVVLDSLNDQLRHFTQGSAGAGAILPTTGVSGSGSGENAELIAITPRACPGDANADGVVDFLDLNLVLSNFGMTGPALAGDLDHDGDVDFIDLNIILSAFGDVC